MNDQQPLSAKALALLNTPPPVTRGDYGTYWEAEKDYLAMVVHVQAGGTVNLVYWDVNGIDDAVCTIPVVRNHISTKEMDCFVPFKLL